MSLEIKIRWEGTAPGLTDKRLSLSAFGEPLAKLLAALRRIASNIVTEALEDKARGRFAGAARQLDIEIADLIKGSSGFDGVITVRTSPGDTFPLLNELGKNAGTKLLDALQYESQGAATNAIVRNYLRSLPAGITRQDYSLHSNGRVLKEISFGEAALPELPPEMPSIAQYLGSIVGVGFEPGRPEVRIKTEAGSATLAATAEQVEAALGLRDVRVKAVAVVQGSEQRLLVLQRSGLPLVRASRQEAIYDRWQGVLRRLAQ